MAAMASAGAAVLLAGCQPKTADTAQPAAGPADAAVPAAPGDVMLDYWNGLTGEDGITMLKICQLWQEKNEGVFVKTQRIPWGQYLEKLLPAMVAGSGPDIFILHAPDRLMEYQPKDVLLPLDDIFDTGLLPRADYRDDIIEPCYADGKLWGMPLDAYGPVLWCNLDLFEQAGVEIDPSRGPLSRDEFLTLVTKLTWDKNGKHPNEAGFDKENVEVWGYAGRDMVGETHRQNGVDRVTMDGSCKSMITDERYVDAVKWGRDLTWEHFVKPAAGFGTNEAFGGGRLAIHCNGSWYYNWFRDYPDTNWGARYFPTIGTEKGVWVGTHSHCLPKDISAAKRDWAFQLIAAMGDSHLWSAEAGMPSARSTIVEHPSVAENWALPMQFAQHAWIYRANLSYKAREEVSGILNPYIAAALNNEKEPLAAMQEAEPQIQAILDRTC
jgi:multiple sugar transport system substrate-binding protein